MEASLHAPRLVEAPGLPAEAQAFEQPAAAAYPAEPWSRRDVIRFATLSVIGLVLLAAGWVGAGGEALFEDQVPFINLAVGGLVVGAAGGGIWFVTGFRAVRARKAAVKERIAARPRRSPVAVAAQPAGSLVSGPSMTRYHRFDCSLVAGKDVTAASLSDHDRAGRRPCGMCRP